jgi:hypothetical protein
VRRRGRLAVAAGLLAGGTAAVGALTSLSSGAQGPLAVMLDRAGTAAGAVEHRVRTALTGRGREGGLDWLAPYREDAARLRRPDRILLGAYDDGIPRTFDGVVRLERALGTTFPLVQVYSAWGDRPEQQFPRKLVTAIWNLGSVPVVTWEPWLADFDGAAHPHLPLRAVRDRDGMGDVARGAYDFYLDAWAAEAAAFGRPILVRLAHEMNDPYRYPWGPQHNARESHVAAWRHVVERFRRAGARNVIWVWSPHVAYEGWEEYYPGDAYVDWVATGVLNYGPIAQWSRWWTFDEMFGNAYPRMAGLGKPVMLAEFGSLAVGGDRAAWYREALAELPRRYPAVRALLLFHAGTDRTVTYQTVDWTVTEDSATARTIADAIRPWSTTPESPPTQ